VIRAWRIDKARHTQASSFSGEGARLAAGRWNNEGRPVVYAASSLSLASLEKFAHLAEDSVWARFVSYEIHIPPSVKIIEWRLSDMPRDWRSQPPSASTRLMGDQWIKNCHVAVLSVPSVITPSETNFLLNPAHSDFAKIKLLPPAAYSFDPRLWK
jgi:RES domain-containing protein